MDELLVQLRQLARTRVQHVRPYTPELQILGSLETRIPGDGYFWDGMKRGADPAHPYIIFQYTIDGWGNYTSAGVTHRLRPGMAFTAVVPSEHSYFLPAASAEWSFFWIMLHHPYVVGRIAQRQRSSGPILMAEPNSPLVLRALDLFAFACQPTLQDAIAREQAIFAFFWEHERAAWRRNAPEDDSELLLDDVRRYVLDALSRPIPIDELARLKGMSRSHFSHHFKRTTGLAPVQFIQRVRLEEATRLLLHTNQPVAAIAQTTGFANANHFCKVFRQRFHLSPGAFRRQMR